MLSTSVFDNIQSLSTPNLQSCVLFLYHPNIFLFVWHYNNNTNQIPSNLAQPLLPLLFPKGWPNHCLLWGGISPIFLLQYQHVVFSYLQKFPVRQSLLWYLWYCCKMFFCLLSKYLFWLFHSIFHTKHLQHLWLFHMVLCDIAHA